MSREDAIRTVGLCKRSQDNKCCDGIERNHRGCSSLNVYRLGVAASCWLAS